jgi:hypothetical protein
MQQYPSDVKTRAQKLRAKGRTYREICQELSQSIPKGTLNYWVRHITPPESYQHKIAKLNRNHLKKVRIKAINTNKQILTKRLEALKKKNQYVIKRVNQKNRSHYLSDALLV